MTESTGYCDDLYRAARQVGDLIHDHGTRIAALEARPAPMTAEQSERLIAAIDRMSAAVRDLADEVRDLRHETSRQGGGRR